MVKSFAFRLLMIFLVTRFFRRPAVPNSTQVTTVTTHPSNPNSAFTPGNLYASGDLLVSYAPAIFLALDAHLGHVHIHQRRISLQVRSIRTSALETGSHQIRRLDLGRRIH